MKHGCVILADVHHPMLEATRGLLDAIFRTVVMVSSRESLIEASEKDIVDSIMRKGVRGYVLKRSTATDLIQAVDKVLNGQPYISPSVASE